MLFIQFQGSKSPDIATQAYLPFKNELWIVLAVIIVGQGFLQILVNIQPSKKPHKPKVHSKPLVHRVSSKAFEHSYLSSMGFLSAAPVQDSKTIASRVLHTGYGFLILVVIASYTAELARFLTESGADENYTSLEDAIVDSAKICVESVMLDAFRTSFPAGDWFDSVRLDDIFDIYLANKTCSVGVFTLASIQARRAKGQSCDWIPVGTPVFQTMNTQPMRQDLSPTISYWIATHRAGGTIAQDLDRFRSDLCNNTFGVTEADPDDVKLSVEHMVSVFIVFFVGIGLGAIVWVIEYMLTKRKIAAKAALRAENDQPDEQDLLKTLEVCRAQTEELALLQQNTTACVPLHSMPHYR